MGETLNQKTILPHREETINIEKETKNEGQTLKEEQTVAMSEFWQKRREEVPEEFTVTV